jgi:hypothetical protein
MNMGAFKQKRILEASSYKYLTEPQFKTNDNRFFNADEVQYVGLSWFIKKYRGFKTVFHSGGDLGFRSQIIMIPEKSLAVIVASNYDGTPINELAFGLIDIMLGFAPQYPIVPILTVMGKTIVANGLQNAIAHYRELKNTEPEKYDFGEAQLNTLGYQLIGSDRLDDAIEIFNLNVEMFPESFNPYDSLGEAYMIGGNKELAIKNYKKSIELNPNNRNGIEMLEKLQRVN